MTAPTPKRRGHPGVDPWQSLPSIRAGLPADRAAWLAVVLPVVNRARSHPEVAKLLTDAGHAVTGSTVRLWHLKLEAMRAAGQLPEHPGAFPARDPGWHEGAPVPSREKAAEGGRRGAETKARAKGAGKGKRAGKGRAASRKNYYERGDAMNGTAPFTFGDLFSGAGGMSFGFRSHQAFRPVFAVDAQVGKPSSGMGALECNATYEANVGLAPREADLSVYSPQRLMRDAGIKRGELDVLISCAPCTGFSRTNSQNHERDDRRNELVERTGEFVAALRPTILVMENARELIRGNFTHHYQNLRASLDSMGYAVSGEVHMLTDFGLPQVRERALLIAVRDRGRIYTLRDLWGGLIPTPESITVRRSIAHLPPVAAGEAHPSDPQHRAPSFSEPVSVERMQAIPKDGGSWLDLLKRPDADRLLTPSMKRIIAARDFGSHPDKYGRLWWDRPCVTIKRECSHVGNGRYAHPEQDRLCTVRELALLSGFPAHYEFLGTFTNRYRHIGDAVPPLISFQLAHLCHWMLTGKRPRRAEWCLPGTSLRPEDIVERREAQTSMPWLEFKSAV